MELFRFRDYDNSVLLANTNTDLPGNPTELLIYSFIAQGRKVVIHSVEPQVIAATNVNPKLVGGRLFPNLASVTLLYFAGECEANTSCVKGDDVPFDESPVEDCGPLQRSHVMVELQKIEVKVGVL
ncbi:unnamed protein product, partial [Brassica oleracea]